MKSSSSRSPAPIEDNARSKTGAIPMSLRGGDVTLKREIRQVLPGKLSGRADSVEHANVRLSEVEGGDEAMCHIDLTMRGMAPVVCEARADDPRGAFMAAVKKLDRAIERAAKPKSRARAVKSEAASDDGELIGRRVGHGTEALGRTIARRRAPHAGSGAVKDATAARNVKVNMAGMTSMLEDSRTTPSRKSTRRSANRSKGATTLQQTAQAKTRSPKARATRAAANPRTQ